MRRPEAASAGSVAPLPSRPLSDAQRLAWLRLIRSENVGPVTFRDLVNHFGGAEQALAALPDLSRRGGKGRAIRVAPLSEAEAEIAAVRRAGARLLAIGEPGYPAMLAHLDVPPPVVCVKGETSLFERRAVAIVGSRNGSAAGQKLTRLFADRLGAAGYVVVSGLARGIDGAAHEAALARGTIAAVAGGIDIVYPPEHASLHAEIGRRGCLISEQPPGFVARAQDFPRRNRLISGLSLGVVVMEAARRSGTLITARYAAEQGREVLAVPGHPLDPRAEGTNRLLKDGATIITAPEDILEALEGIGRERPPPAALLGETPGDSPSGPPPEPDDSDRQRVLDALGPAPVNIDEIARAARLPVRTVLVLLIELDLAGRLERHGSQLVSLKFPD